MAHQTVDGSAQRKRGWLAVTLVLGGRPRTFVPGPWVCGALAIGLPLLATWYLGATLYLVFHDQLLASLITRQTEVQYAYEDRIAGLRTQLDRETSRSLLDRHTLETAVTKLEERSTRLAARADLLDRLVSRNAAAPGAASARPRPPAVESRNPLLGPDIAARLPNSVRAYSADETPQPGPLAPEAPALRLGTEAPDHRDPGASAQAPDDRASLDVPAAPMAARVAIVTAALQATEQDQIQAVAALREPTLKKIGALRSALLELGMPAGAMHARKAGDVGGPFVPLPSSGLSFDQDAALLQDAVLQADQLLQLANRIPLRKPVAGTLEVSSSFGPRLDPFLGRPAMHTGIDFRERYGETVHATAGGTVTTAASEGGYGMMVEVDHGNGLSTRYAHLSSASVVPGQRIEPGAVIGLVGSSGRATGPHLHYETRINGEAVDPARFLKAGGRIFEEN